MDSGAPSAALSSRMQGSPQPNNPTRIEEERKGQGNEGSQAPPTSTTHRQDNKGQKKEPAQLEQQGNTERRGRGRERKEKEPRQAHKPTKKGYPPLLQGAGSRSPPQFFAPKNQQKVAWVVMKKFSEKFFVGMFRGKEKPLALSQRKGVLKMKIVK